MISFLRLGHCQRKSLPVGKIDGIGEFINIVSIEAGEGDDKNGLKCATPDASIVVGSGAVLISCIPGDRLTVSTLDGRICICETIAAPQVYSYRGEGLHLISVNDKVYKVFL